MTRMVLDVGGMRRRYYHFALGSARVPPPGSVSVDLDSFEAMYRSRGWDIPASVRDLNAVYSDALPRFLRLFEEEGIRATLFVVGEDARRSGNRALLERAAHAGHEIGNHSMRHLHLPALPEDEAVREVLDADEILREITGEAIRGFRSPAWLPTEGLLDLLAERGYRYDASVFPTPWLAVWRSLPSLMRIPPRFRRGPDWPWAFAPRVPYLVRPTLMELPAATVPFLRLPVWGTMLHWLGSEPYHALAALCGVRAPASIVLHGWELMDFKWIADPRFRAKPGIERPVDARLAMLRASLRWMKARWTLVPLHELSDAWESWSRRQNGSGPHG